MENNEAYRLKNVLPFPIILERDNFLGTQEFDYSQLGDSEKQKFSQQFEVTNVLTFLDLGLLKSIESLLENKAVKTADYCSS